MTIKTFTLEQARRTARVNRERIAATTEADIARQSREDGEPRAEDLGLARVSDPLNVAAVRAATGLSQTDFARRYGFSLRTLQKWEQGKRRPTGAARTLLRVIAARPDAVEETLRG